MEANRKKLNRRGFLIVSTVVGGVFFSSNAYPSVDEQKLTKGGNKTMRFGDVINSPENEGKEKHVPHIEAPDKVHKMHHSSFHEIVLPFYLFDLLIGTKNFEFVFFLTGFPTLQNSMTGESPRPSLLAWFFQFSFYRTQHRCLVLNL